MALLQYTVWLTAAEVANGPVLAEGTVSIGGASVPLGSAIYAAGGNKSVRVRLMADTACYVTWGTSPTAVNDGSDGRMMGADNPEYFDIPANFDIAVIQRP